MVNLCNICFDFSKSGKTIKDITNVKIVEKNQCNGLHHKKLIDSFKT